MRFFEGSDKLSLRLERLRLFRTDLHAERIDQRQGPEIGLGRPLEEQLVAGGLARWLKGYMIPLESGWVLRGIELEHASIGSSEI
jgi:hypothetical protein